MADKANEKSMEAARVALAAHTGHLMIDGDAGIQVWHLLVSLHEYCAANDIDLEDEMVEVRMFLTTEGRGQFPAWDAFAAAKSVRLKPAPTYPGLSEH